MEAMRRAVTTPAPSPSTLAPDVPEVISEVTLKALERDASKRFATGREMAQALEAAARGKMYDEFMVGAWVREQFPEQLERTRKLMESLSAREEEELKAAASSLAGDGEAPTGRSKSLAPAPATGEAATMELDASRGATILVVDDSSLGRKLVTLRLEAEGFRVVAATSAEEALEYLSEMRPDLVITDVRMGELDGFGLCERIRQREELQLLPVIFLSASCSAEERARGLAVGGDDFIRKPFEPVDLVTRVRSHLRRVAVLRRPASP
jgi:CheY-like chemotaxis protein